jgi:hypothetical protein
MICLFGNMAAAWPLAAYAQSTTHTTQATRASVSKIEVVRVKRIDPPPPQFRSQLRDGPVDLMKVFSLRSLEGIGGAWKMPPAGDTFDARYGQW